MASFCDRAGPTISCEVRRRPAFADMASNAAPSAVSTAFDAKPAFADRAP